MGIAVTHILSHGYEKMFGDRVYYHSHEVPNFDPAGLTAWLVAAGTGLLMTLTGTGTAYAPVVTVVLCVVIYAGLLHAAKPSWFAVTDADTANVQDLTVARGAPARPVASPWLGARAAGIFAPHPPSRRTRR